MYVKSSRSILNALDSPKLVGVRVDVSDTRVQTFPLTPHKFPVPRPTPFSIIIAMENDAVTMEAER